MAALETPHDPRFPDLRNFRDIGGLRTDDGREVRGGVVFRSGTTVFVDAEQSKLLAEELGIRTRVDLRSVAEVEEHRNADLDAQVTPAHLMITAGGVWQSHPDVDHPSESVARHYLRYLEHSGDSLREITRLLADTEGAFLVHCTAGKDRTGTVLAVLLSAIGVTREDVVADYARTRDDLDPLLLQLRGLPVYTERVVALPEESLTAEPRSMELFLDGLEATYGGARAYLASHGVTEDDLDRLAARLLG